MTETRDDDTPQRPDWLWEKRPDGTYEYWVRENVELRAYIDHLEQAQTDTLALLKNMEDPKPLPTCRHDAAVSVGYTYCPDCGKRLRPPTKEPPIVRVFPEPGGCGCDICTTPLPTEEPEKEGVTCEVCGTRRFTLRGTCPTCEPEKEG